MIYSMSYLGGAKYPSLVLRNHPPNFGACFFAEEFGNAHSLVREFLKKYPTCPILQMQLIWHSDHVFGDRDIPTIKRLSKLYNKVATDFPNTDIELSPFCEHRLAKPDKYLDIAKANAPKCIIINSPDRGLQTARKGAFSTKYKNEVHGDAVPPKTGKYNFDFDGSSCFDANMHDCLDIHSRCDVFKMWTWQFNCHMDKDDHTRVVKPTVKHIRACRAVLTNPVEKILPKDWLWKSNCEQTKAVGDVRANKPVLIIPIYTPKVVILDSDGKKVIANMPYYGKYTDGRNRYYAPIWGYEMEEEALKINGSRFVTLKVGNAKYIIRPSLRIGTFR